MQAVYLFADIAIAYLLDLLFGDPYWMPHPVRFIGWLIKTTERLLRGLVKKTGKVTCKREKAAGFILPLIVVSITFLIVYLVLKGADYVNPVLFHILNIYFIYSSLAAKCLANEVYKVYDALKRREIFEARKKLSMLVGRQTENLSEKEIIRASVETTAENTVDGVVSPLIYAIVGSFFGIGAPLAYAFKAVSTLDSMVGYMNDKYINFGCASAKLDDAANYIPARLTGGILIPLSALLCGKNFSKSFRIMLRDRRNHKSPNCAYPESAVAGALGIMIGGTNTYFGQAVEKPTIGDSDKELEMNDIANTIRLMYTASFLTLLFGLAVWGVIYCR